MSQSQLKPTEVTLSEDEFFKQFRPIKNNLVKDASYEGCMFETFGDELIEVKKQLAIFPMHIWTILSSEGEMVIVQGFHLFNRMGYLITELPAQANTNYNINSDESEEIMEGDAQLIYAIDMTDIFCYDTPDEVSEWSWLETHASYKHTGNGHAGIWEFMLNMANEFIDVPARLEKYITEAKQKNIAYLLFHQGT
jgi:hypothetical protein